MFRATILEKSAEKHEVKRQCFFNLNKVLVVVDRIIRAVAILPSTAIYPQRLFCFELFVIGQS